MLSIFAVFLQVVPPVSASSTLGTNASLTGTISPNANYIYFYGPYTAQTTGPISTLKNYIYSGDANAFAKMAIYSDNSNQPGNYLASTSQLNIYGLGSWYNFTGIYYEVTQNTKYWLAVVTNASFFQGLSNSGSWIQYQQASTYPTFVNSASATSGST
jgi:hypothetical protein